MANSKTEPRTPIKDQNSPAKFVKPADLFRMRLSNHSFQLETQSPLKCLNNLTDPSPTKKLPTLLKNPFNQPVKRRLNLGESPNKKTSRMTLELDEDANLEPPKIVTKSRCYLNDWTLRTRFKISFETRCKNWDDSTTSTHKRVCGFEFEQSPSKLNDKTISLEAIKNMSTVYQHPYLAWMPLYPRTTLEDFDKKRDVPFSMIKHSQITEMMHKDWCSSLEDLLNLLIDGRCPYFYLCADIYNILFKQIPSSNRKKPFVQAYITPLRCGMACEFNNNGIQFKCIETSRTTSSNTPVSVSTKENSQTSASFGSSQTRTTINLGDDSTQGSRQIAENDSAKKLSSSVDSGHVSDLDDEDDFAEDCNEDGSQILASLGIQFNDKNTQKAFPLLQDKRKSFVEADSSNTQSRSTSNKPLAVIAGADNLRKLVKFLQTSRIYTINNVGKFACIPPTLLSPREFRLSTPQNPEVVLSKNMIDTKNQEKRQCPITGNPGPTFFELKGTILPNLYKELHKLLVTSDNLYNHTCTSTILESSQPFESISPL